MSAALCFVDTETTGLDPDLHAIWEVALIRRDPDGHEYKPLLFQVRLTTSEIANVDPAASAVNGFEERYDADVALTKEAAGFVIRSYCEGAHLVGNVVSFDEERMRHLLHDAGLLHNWHYHLIDVESMIAGLFGIKPPWKSSDLSRMVEIEPPNKGEAHTALADVQWAKAEYDRVMRIADWTRSHVKRAVITVRNGNDQVHNREDP